MMQREIIVDLFAGGGGASQGIEEALGVSVDEAINHDPEALFMHRANHPHTNHLPEDVFSRKTRPAKVTKGRPVGLLWASPDCTHHSRAKGGKPVSKKIRGLAWVVIKWAKAVKPRVIMLENVPEFREWGPLDDDNKPIKSKKGLTFNIWSGRLRGLGYEVQFREIAACDYGAPTIRKRLFMIARCDGKPIVWPEPTHGVPGNLFGLPAYRTAAECIDWSIPCPSIFLTKAEAKEQKLNIRRPLAENSLKRIAKGLKKFIFDNPEPFIIGIDHASSKGSCVWPISDPLRTTTMKNRFALITPFMAKYYGGVTGTGVEKPLPTITARDHNVLITPFLSRYYGTSTGSKATDPTPTAVGSGHDALVMPFLTKYHGEKSGCFRGQALDKSLLTADTQNRFGLVNAFFVKYYDTAIGHAITEPMHTATAKARFGLVVVAGQAYQIADIGLRMLTPRELARAQGFGDDYILTGTKTSQVAKIGNSVCPPIAHALVKANVQLQQFNKKAVG